MKYQRVPPQKLKLGTDSVWLNGGGVDTLENTD